MSYPSVTVVRGKHFRVLAHSLSMFAGMDIFAFSSETEVAAKLGRALRESERRVLVLYNSLVFCHYMSLSILFSLRLSLAAVL